MKPPRPHMVSGVLAALACAAIVWLATPTHAQSPAASLTPGDTVQTAQETVLWESPDAVAFVAPITPRTLLVVREVRRSMVEVSAGEKQGWVRRRAFDPDRRDRRTGGVRISQPPHLTARPTWRYSRGHGRRSVHIDRLFVHRSRTGGLSVTVLLSNLSRGQTVKYAALALAPGRPAADSLASAPEVPPRTIRAVGPIAPGQTASYTFRNVWRTPSAPCAVVRHIRAVHLDGSGFASWAGLQERARWRRPVKPHGCLRRGRGRQ